MAQSSSYDPVTDSARLDLQSELTLTADLETLDEAAAHIDRRPLRILDAGCGTGAVTVSRFGRWPDARVLGIDRSPTAVVAARRRAHHLPQLSFRTGELEQLGADLGQFDVVFCALVLHVAPDPRAVVSRLWDLTAPGGKLVVRSPDDALSLCWPSSPDAEAIDRLTPEVFREVDRVQGRKLPSLLGSCPGAAEVSVRLASITTLCRPGPAGRAAFFEFAHGWKRDAVMSVTATDPSRASQYRDLAAAIEAERRRFATDDALFAAKAQVIVVATKA